MQNVKIIAICVVGALLLGVFSFLIYTNHSLNAELTKTKEKLAECNIAIDVQNKAIEEIRLDTEKFKQDIELENENIRARYRNVSHNTHTTCEGKLNQIDEALHLFYQRKH